MPVRERPKRFVEFSLGREAATLLRCLIPKFHVIADTGEMIYFTFAVTPHVLDAMSLYGARYEDHERDDFTDEDVSFYGRG